MKWLMVMLLTCAGGWAGWRLVAPRTMPAASGNAVKPSVSARNQVPAQPPTVRETTDPLSLLDVPESEYPARLRRAFQQGWQSELAWLARRWAARDPAGLFAFMTAPKGLGLGRTQWRDWAVTEACFEAWFQKDLPAAMAAMETLQQYDPDAGRMGHHGWHAILPKLLLFDPARAVQFLAEHADYGDDIILNYSQYRDLAEISLTLPECASRPGILRNVFHAFAKDPDPAKGMADGLAWLAKLPPGVRLEALPQLADVDADALPTVRKMIRRSFSMEDLTAVAEAGQETHENENKQRTLARLRAMLDPAEAMAWAANSLDGKARLQAMEEIVRTSLPVKPEELGPFIEALPPGPLQDQALKEVIGKWSETQGHQAAADWIATLPEAETRQAALNASCRILGAAPAGGICGMVRPPGGRSAAGADRDGGLEVGGGRLRQAGAGLEIARGTGSGGAGTGMEKLPISGQPLHRRSRRAATGRPVAGGGHGQGLTRQRNSFPGLQPSVARLGLQPSDGSRPGSRPAWGRTQQSDPAQMGGGD